MHVVTGATGRLGSHLVKALLLKGRKVKALVRSREEPLPEGVVAHTGDITKPETLEGLLAPKDTVFHLAAVINENSSDSAFHAVNVLGTENMLRACKGNRISRFVFVSSVSVFGNPETLPADESCHKNPISKYGKSKMLAEEAVMRQWRAIPSVILRPGMIYGPGFDEGYLTVLKMLEQRKMPVIGDGGNRIPLVHVSDAVDALILVSESEEAVKNDFNLAGPVSPTQKELLSLACRELGVEEPTRSIPIWAARAVLPLLSAFGKTSLTPENLLQLTADRALDGTKIGKKLGFEPKVTVSQGIKEMVAYYKARKVVS